MAAGKGGKYFIGARKDGCSPNGLRSAGARPSPFFSAPWGEKCFPLFLLPLGGGRSQRSEDPSTSSDGGRRGEKRRRGRGSLCSNQTGRASFSLPSPSFSFHSREKRLSVDHCFERGGLMGGRERNGLGWKDMGGWGKGLFSFSEEGRKAFYVFRDQQYQP